MTSDEEAARIGFSVPLVQTATFSRRRTTSAVVAWLLCLSGIVALGLVAHLPDVDQASPPVAEVEARPIAGIESPPNHGTSHASSVQRHTFGEDGLMGGIVFGDNIPAMDQADIERDGYRRYHLR